MGTMTIIPLWFPAVWKVVQPFFLLFFLPSLSPFLLLLLSFFCFEESFLSTSGNC